MTLPDPSAAAAAAAAAAVRRRRPPPPPPAAADLYCKTPDRPVLPAAMLVVVVVIRRPIFDGVWAFRGLSTQPVPQISPKGKGSPFPLPLPWSSQLPSSGVLVDPFWAKNAKKSSPFFVPFF